MAQSGSKPKQHGALHGDLEFLQNSILQSPSTDRLLEVARRSFEVEDYDAGFQALLSVFAESSTTFTRLDAEGRAFGTYQVAIDLLRNSDAAVRRHWTEVVSGQAEKQFRSHLLTGSTAELTRVRRMFPLTPAGFKAGILEFRLYQSLGQTQFARLLLDELTAVYAQTSIDNQRTLNALHRAVDQDASPTMPGGDADRWAKSLRGIGGFPTADALSMPWPEPVWTFSESEAIWDHPEYARPLGGLLLPENRDVLRRNRWLAIPRKNDVIIRTPLRLLAVERKSGQILWTLSTDTQQQSEVTEALDQEFAIRDHGALLDREEFCSVTTSGDSLFFFDHFREFGGTDQYGLPRSFRGVPLQLGQRRRLVPTSSGADEGRRRLVAIQAKPGDPQILWTRGTSGFEYRIQDADANLISAMAARSDETFSEETRFLGRPLVFDQMLYVLTEEPELIVLHCLSASTGRTVWSRPLSYRNERSGGDRSRFITVSEPDTSVCGFGIQDNILICTLTSGLAFGVSLPDGELKWSTNFRDSVPNNAAANQRSMIERFGRERGFHFRPLFDHGVMIWAADNSAQVRCVRTSTGELLWSVPRFVESPGALEGSHDDYAAWLSEDRVILLGERHVRSLSVSDGDQHWVTTIQPQTGFADCDDNHCLIPLVDGTIISVRTADGKPDELSRGMFRRHDRPFAGGISGDSELTFITTPVSVTALPKAQPLLDELRSREDLSEGQQLRLAELLLLDHDVSEGIEAFQTLCRSSDTEVQQKASRLLADVTLHLLAERRFSGEATESEFGAGAAVLDQLPLLPEQQILRAVCDATFPIPAELLDVERLGATVVSPLPDWSVRGDMLLAAESDTNTERLQQSLTGSHQSLAGREFALAFPGTLADDALSNRSSRKESSPPLLEQELQILSGQIHSADNDTDLQRELRQLRGLQTAPKHLPASEPVRWEIETDERLLLRADSRVPEIVDAAHAMLESPSWYRNRIFMVQNNLFEFDPSLGTVSAPIALPGAVDATSPTTGPSVPGLIPLVGHGYLGALSVSHRSKPEVAWWRAFRNQKGSGMPLEIGPVGPSFMIVADASELSCLHPLTGNTLWSRTLYSGVPGRSLFRQMSRMTGDATVVGVLGANLRGFSLFDTRTGRSLGTRSLNIGDNQTPLMFGRHVLFHENGILKLIDIATGADELKTNVPIRVQNTGHVQLLGESDAILLTEDVRAIVIDLQTGHIRLDVPLGEKVDAQRVTGIKAERIGDNIHLLVKDWGNTGSLLSASSRIGDLRMDSGTLCCLNPQTEALLWTRDCVPSVWPVIHGDPIGLHIAWSWKNQDLVWERRLGGGLRLNGQESADSAPDRSVVMEIIDQNTGATVQRIENLAPFEPFSCYHSADEKTIKIETERSIVTLHYEIKSARAK
ncbi:MAG: PQQ-binding-like beta-propeller repeat protein [Planctomycetaceae bacterium]|nr:PQQ-binding-like beta-propeller repeat protein [Planctomycetaceae bacterium]